MSAFKVKADLYYSGDVSLLGNHAPASQSDCDTRFNEENPVLPNLA